jgi:hypothetical protein
MIRDNGIGIDMEQHGEMIFFHLKELAPKRLKEQVSGFI